MIKGVNKQVLEISEPQSGFFEKAIFFVKPEYSGMAEGRLREKAKQEFNIEGYPPKSRIKANKLIKFIVPVACFICGVVAGTVFCALL